MMKVHVRIEKFNRDHDFLFDNLVPRDEVIHKLLSESKEYKDLYDAKQLQDSDIFITWTDPNAPIEVAMTTEEAVVATEAAPEIAQPRIAEDAAGTTEPVTDDAVLGSQPVADIIEQNSANQVEPVKTGDETETES